jgi:UDP:flavonoid glycosyltransferase YjiC (YdhE family)
LPLLPLAAAFAARGDGVAVAAAANHRERVESLGLQFEPAGPTLAELTPKIDAHRARLAAVPVSDRRRVAFSGRFAEIEAPLRLQHLRDFVEAWQPDVVIHESADLAAPIAAAACGLPAINHAFGLPIPEVALRTAAKAVAPLWRSLELDPDPLAGAYRGQYIDICPPSLRRRLPQAGSRLHVLRPAEAPPAGHDPAGDRPRVYATLGTRFNALETFRLLLDVFEDVDCDVVMTVGRDQSPHDLGPIPPNVTVAQYIPQAEILADCDAVVAHAGSGTVFAALAHGRPLVLLPQAADQFENAAACAALGVAETILPQDLALERVRDAVESVLDDSAYTNVARGVAAEIAAMPSAAMVADEIAAGR